VYNRFNERRKILIDNQENLRNDTKRLKWEYGISYKEIAIDLLDMDYHSFINWVNGRCKLGRGRTATLRDFISCIL
jgi:hypothetical protein